MLTKTKMGVRVVLCGQVLTLLDHPHHLIAGLLCAGVRAGASINLPMFTRNKVRPAVSTVGASTFSVLDGSTTVTLEAFSGSSSDYGRPPKKKSV